jgi:aspartate/methionine/tyrosine aminotransferase
VTEPAKRFPILEHLSWARFQAGKARYSLSKSQVPPPPPEVLDTGGPMPLVVDAGIRADFTDAIAARYRIKPDEITLTAGVSEALYVTSAGLVSPGDVVAVESPGYQSLAMVPAALGAEVKRIRRGLDGRLEAHAACAEIESISGRARAEGKKLAAVLLSDLHNPSGARLDDETVVAIAGAVESSGAVLVIDEVYRDSDSMRSIGSSRNRHPATVTLSSLTKSYGMGGLRAGWISAPVSRTREFTQIQNYLSVQPSAPSMVLAARALRGGDAVLKWSSDLVRPNRERFRAVISGAPGGFVCPAEAAGNVVFPYRRGGPDTRAEVARWLEVHEVEVVPGVFFDAPEGFRMGLGLNPDIFEEAIGKWVTAVSAVSDETKPLEASRPDTLGATGDTRSARRNS